MIRIDDNSTALNECRSRYQIGDIDVSVTGDDEILNDFADLYVEGDQRRDPLTPTIRMEVRKSKRRRLGRTRYAIAGDGKELFGELHTSEVLPYLEWGINWRVIERCTDYLLLHAATLALDGQGVVLAGSSGVGKSTLAAGLISRGWTYLSDEFALIHPDTLRLHPFPKALCIKAGSFTIINRLNLPLLRRRHYVKAFKGPVGYVRPQDVASYTVPVPCPVRVVIFPKYAEGDAPRLYPIPPGHAGFRLAGYAFNRKAFGTRAVSILSEVVRGAECLGLVSGPIEETCDLVESLFSPNQSRSS